jgi:hypothetical protein
MQQKPWRVDEGMIKGSLRIMRLILKEQPLLLLVPPIFILPTVLFADKHAGSLGT